MGRQRGQGGEGGRGVARRYINSKRKERGRRKKERRLDVLKSKMRSVHVCLLLCWSIDAVRSKAVDKNMFSVSDCLNFFLTHLTRLHPTLALCLTYGA